MREQRFEAVLRSPWNGPWRLFRNPERIVMALEEGEVRSCLQEVDVAVKSGLYAAGFVAYEAAGAFGMPVKSPRGRFPLAFFGLFSPCDVSTVATLQPRGEYRCEDWIPSVSRSEYLSSIRQVRKEIEAGNTYQTNFTFQMTTRFSGDPKGLFNDLVSAQQGAWAAYLTTHEFTICSASPELFFAFENERFTCRPMKGTARRGRSSQEDLSRRDGLGGSGKDRAENVMIVDLVRNDLGKLALTGSVTVDSLFDVEQYPDQWHLTSSVSAALPPASLLQVFEALFPSGSVTGAPKLSSMGIIRNLENRPRGIYTGSIGYVGPDGRGHFNVAIRSVVIDHASGIAEFGVGSGIVWDSIDSEEYEECLIKAAMLTSAPPTFELLESLLWDRQSGYFLLDLHLDRLLSSARYFGFCCDRAEVLAALSTATTDCRQPSKVRLLLSADGGLRVEAETLSERRGPLILSLARKPIDSDSVFLYHKTTNRQVYESAAGHRPDTDAVLLWNEARDVTECSLANIVLRFGNQLVTPTVDSGLLPGVFRRHLLDSGIVVERRVALADLRRADELWAVNSVRKWMKAVLFD